LMKVNLRQPPLLAKHIDRQLPSPQLPSNISHTLSGVK
jgi:hypothetical protein